VLLALPLLYILTSWWAIVVGVVVIQIALRWLIFRTNPVTVDLRTDEEVARPSPYVWLLVPAAILVIAMAVYTQLP